MPSKNSEVATKKPNAKSPKSKKTTLASQIISAANEIDRHKMIATAAYFRAEKRGFKGNGTDAEHDWFEAESEIADRV
jgi:DUF2934 family protein